MAMTTTTAFGNIEESMRFIRNLNLQNKRLCDLKVAYPPEYNSSSSQNQLKNNKCKNDQNHEDDGFEELLKDIDAYINEDFSSPNNNSDRHSDQINEQQINEQQINEQQINEQQINEQQMKVYQATQDVDMNTHCYINNRFNEIEQTSSSYNCVNNHILMNTIAVPCYQLVYMDTVHFCTLTSYHRSFGPWELDFVQYFTCITCGASWIYTYPVFYL